MIWCLMPVWARIASHRWMLASAMWRLHSGDRATPRRNHCSSRSTGLTHLGAEGNPDKQKGVIVDGLTRWATRHGGDASQVAAAIRPVLDEYPPAR